MKHWGRKMKLTKERLIEIIKEEYQNILNEKTVRMSSMDINFQSSDRAQLIGTYSFYFFLKVNTKFLSSPFYIGCYFSFCY